MIDSLVTSLHDNSIQLQRAFLGGWVAVKAREAWTTFGQTVFKSCQPAGAHLPLVSKKKLQKDPKIPTVDELQDPLAYLLALNPSDLPPKCPGAEGTCSRASALYVRYF